MGLESCYFVVLVADWSVQKVVLDSWTNAAVLVIWHQHTASMQDYPYTPTVSQTHQQSLHNSTLYVSRIDLSQRTLSESSNCLHPVHLKRTHLCFRWTRAWEISPSVRQPRPWLCLCAEDAQLRGDHWVWDEGKKWRQEEKWTLTAESWGTVIRSSV